MEPTSVSRALVVLLLAATPEMTTAAPDHGPTTHSVARVIPDSVSFDQEIADGNRVHVTTTNHGFFGNNFLNRTASFEYPAGLGYEHLTHAGLWVGARAQDAQGTFSGVTTGVVDIALGPTSPDASEWTPGDRAIVRRSRSTSSPYYDPHAISDMDLTCRFNDFTPTRAAGNSEDHRSMGIEVRQETYQWGGATGLEDVLFVHLTLWNRGPALADLWVGVYTELASGNKAAYVNWPPSSGDPSGQGGWFTNKWIAYDATHRLLREHYCDRPPLPPGPTNCLLERAPYWAGVKILTPPDAAAGQSVTLAAWSWSPGSVYRDTDAERYAILSAGTIQPLDGDSLLPSTGDPVEVIGLGPFPFLATGDSITVDFALLGGAEIETIRQNAEAAQGAYDRGYHDIPVPVLVSRAVAEAMPGSIRLAWHVSGQERTLRLERRTAVTDWRAHGALGRDGSGVLAFEDHEVIPGTRYGYRLATSAGDALQGSEVWVEASPEPGFALEARHALGGASSSLRLRLDLAPSVPARLDVFDVAGRRVWSRRWVPDGGPREVAVEDLASGVYLVRLHQGRRLATARGVVAE